MATTQRKRKSKRKPAETQVTPEPEPAPIEVKPDRILDEVAGVVTLLVSILLITSLVSFSPQGGNLVGPVGHFFADSVLFLFGIAAFAFVLVTLTWGVALLRGKRLFTRHREVLGYLLVLATAPALLHMGLDAPVLGHPPGGIMGGLLGGVIVAGLGPVGGLLCCVTSLLIAVMLVTDQSLGEMVIGGARKVASTARALVTRPTRHELFEEMEPVVVEAAEPVPEPVIEESAPAKDANSTSLLIRVKRSVRSALARAREDSAEAVPSDEESLVADAVPTPERVRPVQDSADPEVSGPIEIAAAADVGDDPPWVMDLSGSNDRTTAPSSAAEPAIEREPAAVMVPRPPITRSTSKRRFIGRSADQNETPPPAPAVPANAATEERPEPEPSFEAAHEPIAAVPASSEEAVAVATGAAGPESIGPVIVRSRARKSRRQAAELERAQQVNLPLADAKGQQWDFPPLSFLRYEDHARSDVDQKKLRDLAARLEKVLADFKVKGQVSGICPGPVVTLFEFEPESGTKLSRISGLSDDIAMALRAHKVRIIAPIPGKGCVGIEVPNDHRETVFLKEILADPTFTKAKSKLTMALGKDIEGLPVVMDLAKSPHLLIAGTTGSGKSVSVNAMITSLLYNTTPDEVKMILIDPKQLEFAIYENVPHLLLPVVTDPSKAATALNWAVQEMERRYKLMSELKVRNLKGYNEKLAKLHAEYAALDRSAEDYVPSPNEALLARVDLDERLSHRQMYHLVVVVDEFADLMMVAGKEVEVAVARLAQKARASGIHVILATQRPSVDVITGLIKANFPTRISFRLMSGTDSRTVLDTIGSENLLGMGDMLYRPPGTSTLQRVHGAFVDEAEIEQVVNFVAAQRKPDFDESILAGPVDDGSGSDEPVDELYDQAVSVVIEAGFASISMVQRKLRIGYNRSARIVEEMERQGLVGPTSGGSSRREVLVGGAHIHAPM